MRAAVVERVGAIPSITDHPDPGPAADEVLVEVRAATVNAIDLHIAMGRYRDGPPQTPYVPGLEGVGRVLEGSSLVPGTRVRFEVVGRHPGYGTDGSLAERALAPSVMVTPVPDGLNDDVVAALGNTGITAWRVLEVAGVHAGDTVVVLGATGAVGGALVQLAGALGGGGVVAVGRSAAGLVRAERLGASATVALSEGMAREDLAAALCAAAPRGIDAIVDGLWGMPALAALDAASPGVRFVNFGQAAGAVAELASATLLRKGATVRGISTALDPLEVRRRAYERVLEHALAGQLTVDYERLPLDSIGEAWLRQDRSPGRKLVIAV